ncbi:aldo/keto reductase [Occultella aeris]|uniref:Putative oxidoreductase/MSMEI_2347 n=1 Tax=Occultella aeris TaxID=2761496 RepID=A0A7M4DNC0_9MICO|nr:aldo/keto reductase [Occultella aeris]VZO38932.1 putative oxidoreductase/MSMEI_2347 [Occultella aeris]
MTAPTLTLTSGTTIPALGLGTWPMDDADVATAVETAIGAGYRLIDTAENYGNEAGVGEGVRRSGIDRGEVFLTTKFNEKWHSYDGVRQAFEASAARLGVDYIDLFLAHWPRPAFGGFVEAVRGLVALREEGLIRAVGVSNFKPAHLQAVLDAGLVPDVNQIKRDPRNPRRAELAFHAEHGILTEAYTPLGKAGDLLAEPAITQAAQAHGRTPAQVVLRWHTQTGAVPIPKSANPGRIAENIAIFDFELTADEIAGIDALDTGDADVADSDVVGH